MLDAGLHQLIYGQGIVTASFCAEKVSLLIKSNYCRPDDFRASIEAPKLPRLLDRLLEG